MIYQNTIIQFVAFFIPNRKLRHTFRDRFKTKSKYDILHDENIMLSKEIERLKAQCKSMRHEYICLIHKYASPEQIPNMLKEWFFERTGRVLNLDKPYTFNEKIQWIKLNDIDELKTNLTDKYAVRDWVKERIGDKYLIPLLGVYDKPDEIEWDKLPNEFVIKCNHGSGWNIIIEDKNRINKNDIESKLSRWLNTTFGIYGFERQYFKISPKILIEKKLENKANAGMINYRLWCFNGSVKFIQYHTDQYFTDNRCEFFSLTWERLGFAYNHPLLNDDVIEKPKNLDAMISIAKVLCNGFKFVRVDLYCLNDGSIYFSEMTFTPNSGQGKWVGKDMDAELGNMLQLQ